MNILEKLENSYNRKVQRLVIKQLDIIDSASKRYTDEKIKYKLIFLEKANPIALNITREKALLKNFRSEQLSSFKILKNTYLNDISELKETRDFDIKEAKLAITLIKTKIYNNYKKAYHEYKEAFKNNKSEMKIKLNKFENDFKIYYQKELFQRITHRDETISLIKKRYQENYNKRTKQYQNDFKNLKETFTKINKKTIKKEKKQIISKDKQEIKNLKKIMKLGEVKNQKNLKLIKIETKKVKRLARLEIKQINKEAKAVINKMSLSEKRKFKELQKYINEDYRLRRKAKLDQKEALILKKINPAYIYVAPAFFGEVFFTLLPFIFMIVGSLFRVDFTNLSNSKWLGVQNFVRIFTKDVEFQKAVSNTIIYSFITVVLLTVVTISMAAWLAKNTKVHNLAQTMVFTPHIASLVSISILWIAMLNPNGIINQILAIFNIKGPAWLLQENTSLFSVSLVTVWKDIGYYVLIIISGLQGIPAYVYEAAKLDKASKASTFFKITLPLLAPTLSFVFLTKFINSFKVFAPIEIMTNGGPMGSSMVLSYWIYKVGRIGFNYGQAMAGAIVLTLMIGICTFLNNRYFRKIVRY